MSGGDDEPLTQELHSLSADRRAFDAIGALSPRPVTARPHLGVVWAIDSGVDRARGKPESGW